jgi:sterol 3beta-glucosyltransferase
MRFLLLSLGSRGDTQPYAALGLALQAQGHQAVLCVPENFGPFVTGLGLEHASLPWNTQASLADPSLQADIRGNHTFRFFQRIKAQAWERRRAMGAALLTAAQDCDAIVCASTTEDLAVLLGAYLDKPVLQTELAPLTPSSGFAAIGFSLRDLGGPLNRLSHGLSRFGWWRLNRAFAADLAAGLGIQIPFGSPALAAQRAGAPVLHGYSRHLAPRPADWSEAQHPISGAWQLGEDAQRLHGDHQDAGFTHWLEDGTPPLFMSFGSMAVLPGEELLELAGDLAEALEARVVLGLGWSQIDSPDCDLPEGVALSGDCDHAWLFSRCSAVIHHGGAGSTHSAAASGLPQVVCPFFADQPFWAERVRRTGAGVVLPFKRLGAQSLVDAVGAALQEPVQDAAAQLGAALQEEGGAAAGARWLVERALASQDAKG